ncbi:MAG: DUF3638 domain-containing protein, partial [Flavobacteriaceae bacterium]|nr:DUF3638 domain-containing protein [Flavobacteriaceae bacterium]
MARKCTALRERASTIRDMIAAALTTSHHDLAMSSSGRYRRRNWGSTGMRFVPSDVSQCVCFPGHVIPNFFPSLDCANSEGVAETVHHYNIMCALVDKCSRIICMTQDREPQDVDLKGLLRDLTSPRDRITAHPAFVALEAEQKIQIWKSQIDTLDLMKQPGTVVQLNMGEGKTQVIIPLLVLRALVAEHQTPQIVLLSSLLSEAQLNYERTLMFSGFQIPLLQRPFQRDRQVTAANLAQFDRTLAYFGGKAVVLLSREHYASLLLKCRVDPGREIPLRSRFPMATFLDEVDELLSPAFRLVYSVNASQPLPESEVRTTTIYAVLRLVAELVPNWVESGVATMSPADAEHFATTGAYPNFEMLPDDELPGDFDFCEHVFDSIRSSLEFHFLGAHLIAARDFICDPRVGEDDARPHIGDL